MTVQNPSVLAKINNTIAKEGGYVNNPNDKGGETNHGITVATARAWGYNGPMSALSVGTAIEIYASRFWNQPQFDRINSVDAVLAERMFDWGVTSGPSVPSQYLQRILNVLNRQGADYADIAADGRIGPATVYALNQFIAKRGMDGVKVLRGMMQAQQSNFYFQLAEKDPTQEQFEFGWQLNRALGG